MRPSAGRQHGLLMERLVPRHERAHDRGPDPTALMGRRHDEVRVVHDELAVGHCVRQADEARGVPRAHDAVRIAQRAGERRRLGRSAQPAS